MARRGKGEGSVSRLGDGRWRARLRVDGQELTRERRTKKEALQALRQLQVRAGLEAGADQPLADYLDEWLEGLQLRPTTVKRYELDVRLRLKPELGQVRLDKLTAVTIQAAYGRMMADGATASTIQHCHVTLSSALSSAAKWNLIAESPARLVDLPEHEPAPPRPLSEAEAISVLATADGDRLETMWWLLMTLGPRWGQLRDLTWEDLDLDAGWIRLPRSKAKRKVPRLPLTPLLVSKLKAHRQRQREEQMAAVRWESHNLVFTQTKYPGRALRHSTALDAWRAACKRAGIPDWQEIRIHDGRHSVGSMLGEDTAPRQIMDILGHASMSMSTHYSQQHEAQLRAALQRLTDRLAGGTGEASAE